MNPNLFIYLEKEEYVETWVGGGVIPIKLASHYFRDERKGIFTPDENLINSLNIDVKKIGVSTHFPTKQLILNNCSFQGCNFDSVDESPLNATLINSAFYGNSIGDKPIPDIVGSRYYDDGVVMCFSTTKSWIQARKFGRVHCVQIIDLGTLKSFLDQHIGTISECGLCEYTSTHYRTHFLKHVADAWQTEYRLFWPRESEINVRIPAGIAKVVKIK